MSGKQMKRLAFMAVAVSPTGAAAFAAPAAPSYACPVHGDERSVAVSADANGCEATYQNVHGGQVIWKSAHDPKICEARAAAFVEHLKTLGIVCSPR